MFLLVAEQGGGGGGELYRGSEAYVGRLAGEGGEEAGRLERLMDQEVGRLPTLQSTVTFVEECAEV